TIRSRTRRPAACRLALEPLEARALPSFLPPIPATAGKDPGHVAVADFNGDGYLDLAVGNVNGNDVTVLRGNGHGRFRYAGTYPVDAAPSFVAVGDFNGDGNVDLVVAKGFSVSGATVSVLLGNGDGTFQAVTNYAVGSDPRAVAVGDFNADGNQDLAVANFW